MSTVKKLFLVLVVLVGAGFLLLLFLWNNFLSESQRSNYLDGQSVNGIAFDSSGQAWISICEMTIDYRTSGNTATYTGDIGTFKDGIYTSRAGNLDLSDKSLNNLVVDQQGRPWGTVYLMGLVVYDGQQWIIHSLDEKAPKDAILRALAVAPNGNLWLGLNPGGINVFDGQKWILYDTSNSGLTSDNVMDITFEQQGKAWVATLGGGINVFDGKSWYSITSKNSNLPWDNIWSIAIDPKGRLWVGTNLDLYVQDGQNWIPYSLIKAGMSSSAADMIVFDGRGRTWVADRSAYDASPVVFDGSVWMRYQADFSRAYYIRSMKSDDKGRIWLGSSNNRGFSIVSTDYNLPGRFVSTIKVFLSTSGISFLALLLLGVRLTIVFDSYLGTGLGMCFGLAILMAAFFLGQGVLIQSPTNIYSVPGTAITILGTAGGILGKVLGRSKPIRWQIIGALAGLIPSIIITFFAMLVMFVFFPALKRKLVIMTELTDYKGGTSFPLPRTGADSTQVLD